jgi:hypothetical protein
MATAQLDPAAHDEIVLQPARNVEIALVKTP